MAHNAFTAYKPNPAWFNTERANQVNTLQAQLTAAETTLSAMSGKKKRKMGGKFRAKISKLEQQIAAIPVEAYKTMLCPALNDYLVAHASDLTWTFAETVRFANSNNKAWAKFETTLYATQTIPTTISPVNPAGASTAFTAEVHFHDPSSIVRDKIRFRQPTPYRQNEICPYYFGHIRPIWRRVNEQYGHNPGKNGDYPLERQKIRPGYNPAHPAHVGDFGDDAFDFGYESASDLLYEPQNAMDGHIGQEVGVIGGTDTAHTGLLAMGLMVGMTLLLFVLCAVGVVCFVSGMFVGGTVLKGKRNEEDKREMPYQVVSIAQEE